MFDAFKKLQLASAFIGHAQQSAGPPFSLSDVLGDLGERQLERLGSVDELMAQPGVGQLYENRYLPAPESLDVLLDLPPETLGHTLGLYLQRHRLRIAPPPADFDFRDRLAYIRERVRMTHAILHVVTGHDASVLGELAVQAYIIGQTSNLVSGAIIAAGLLQIIRETPAAIGDALQVMAEANERGRQARSFLAVPWEEFWSVSLDDIREIAGIPPRTSTLAALDLARLAAEAAGMPRGDAPAEPPAAAAEPARSSSDLFRLNPEPARPTTSELFRLNPEPARPATSELFRLNAEPARPITRSFVAPEPKKPQRWAGLDLLSQVGSEPEPTPEPEPAPAPAPEPTPPPEPEPEPRARPEHQPLVAPSPELRARPAPKPSPSLTLDADADIFAPPLPPLEIPRSDPDARPRFDPPRPPPLPDRAEPSVRAPAPTVRAPEPAAPEPTPHKATPRPDPAAPPRPKPPPHKAPPGTEPGYVEIDDVADNLPQPGDPDYF